jgi:dipeptidyl aminopeptidase/acylaminoacyl peptidase
VTTRIRLIALGAIVVIAIACAAAYVLASRSTQQATASKIPTSVQTPLPAVENQPHIVFRDTEPGTQYGHVAMVALSDTTGPRGVSGTTCDRVYSTTGQLLCVASVGGLTTTYSAKILSPTTFASSQTLPLAGIPSRARLSADGKLAATTTFVSGDSYAGTSFSTRTQITRVGGSTLGTLEDFTLVHDGESITPVDRNFWGVTFASDDNLFYATAQWNGHTWLVRGQLDTKTMVTIQEDAECPSLSPDGTQVVYKQQGTLPRGQWRLVDYNVATHKITKLAEQNSVDDQVEWLDSTHVIYGLPRSGTSSASSDVWSVPVDGTGKPTMIIPYAWSPAVVR